MDVHLLLSRVCAPNKQQQTIRIQGIFLLQNPLFAGRAELNAPLPAQDPLGPVEPWPEHTRQSQGAAGYGP